jgi:hypothetical protein
MRTIRRNYLVAGARTAGEVFEIVLHRPHLRRTATIAVLVGTWLTLFNQGDAIINGTVSTFILGKICLNYVTPFVVANLGLLSGQRANHSNL